jgi:hypothetical protein
MTAKRLKLRREGENAAEAYLKKETSELSKKNFATNWMKLTSLPSKMG